MKGCTYYRKKKYGLVRDWEGWRKLVRLWKGLFF